MNSRAQASLCAAGVVAALAGASVNLAMMSGLSGRLPVGVPVQTTGLVAESAARGSAGGEAMLLTSVFAVQQVSGFAAEREGVPAAAPVVERLPSPLAITPPPALVVEVLGSGHRVEHAPS